MQQPVFDATTRRARLVRRHRLAPRFQAETPEEIAASLVAIHSTDPATVYLSVGARLAEGDPVAALERALYDDRSLIRMHGMRKTIFVFPAVLAGIVHASTTAANAEAISQYGLASEAPLRSSIRVASGSGSISDRTAALRLSRLHVTVAGAKESGVKRR